MSTNDVSGLLRLSFESFGQSGEVIEHSRDQFLAAWIPPLGSDGKKLDEISRLCCRFGPRGRGSRDGVALELLLAGAQGCLIGLDFMQAPPNFRRFLSGHAAMLVEFNWVISQVICPSPGL